MARGNPKPTEKTNWIPDDTTNIVPPSAGRKLVGWLFNIKPPAEIFNWFWNLKSRFEDYFAAQAEDWIVIDSDADEGDYATLTAYLADAPAAGDRVLIKEDQTVTVQTVIPLDITLKFLDGSRLLCATNIATSVLQFGSNIIIEGVLNIVLSQTGVTAKAVELNGDNVTGKINVENSSTGTLTTGYHINASKTGNRIDGFIDNTGGGVLTNEYVDNSAEDSNLLVIVDNQNSTIKTNGSAFVDLLNDQSISGIKTFLDEIVMSGGIETDNVTTKTKMLHIGPWDMSTATGTINAATAHGLTVGDIRGVRVTIRSDNGDLLPPSYEGPANTKNGAIWSGSATNITVSRNSGQIFDSASFDLTENIIDAAAAVDKGNGLVGIPITGHDFNAKDITTIAGTTNYDGTHKIVSETANEIVIEATFVSEAFAGTETASWSRGWIFVEYEI